MENERIINGKRCRLYDGLWFADTGDFVARYDEDNGRYESCTIYTTNDLGACVEEMFYPERLDVVIAELFGNPHPPYGKVYCLLHKDGNEMNCDYRNLEWKEINPFLSLPNNSTAPKVFLRLRSSDEASDWERIKQNFDPITGQPIVPQISSSPENPPAPFTPPSFSSFGKAPDIGDNPFKPI